LPPNDDDLADRFRKALEDQEAAIDVARTRPLLDVAEARAALFARLTSFAGLVQQIEARPSEDALRLVFGERAVCFTATNAGVKVTYEGWPLTETHTAWPEPALDGRWVLEFRRLGRVEQMPLFERGLEELLVHGLGLPRPSAVDRPISARTAAALTGRAPETPPAARSQGSRPERSERSEADAKGTPKRSKRDL
jgi:hypothetical protein